MRLHPKIIYAFLLLLLLVGVFADLAFGSANISLGEFFNALWGKGGNPTTDFIIFHVRMPRVVTALITGASLSVAGLLLQTLFHNPLAGPYVLGISSGAGLGVAIYIMASVAFIGISPAFIVGGQVMAALTGSVLVFFLILSFSWRLGDSVSLLLIGMMVGSLASAIVGILEFFASAEYVHKYVVWSLGSLAATNWLQLSFLAPLFVFATGLSLFLLKPMDALLMGEMHARVSGINVKKVRIAMIVISSLLAGTITAFTGPIAFVGMTVPHIVRLISGKVLHRVVLPGSILVGALLMVLCDIISQLPGKAVTLPINAVTALFGAPVVVVLILRNRKMKVTF
ncbi:MAG: iron ABC transporter permease [Bacteroidales bacterium]|nr:iron ABC transporter permease [Bacteroidales bacterium]